MTNKHTYTCNYCQENLTLLEQKSGGNIYVYECDRHEYPLKYYAFYNVSRGKDRLYALVIDIDELISFHVDPMLNREPYIRFGEASSTSGTCINLDRDLLSLGLDDVIRYCKAFIKLRVLA